MGIPHCFFFLPFLQRETTLSLPACCLGWRSSCKVEMSGWWLTISPIFTKENNFESTCLLSWMGKLLQSGDEWMVAHCLFLPLLQWETTLSLPAYCLGWGSSCKVGMSGWWLTVYFSHFYNGKQLWVYLLIVLDGEALAKWGWVDGGSLFISPIFTMGNNFESTCLLSWMGKLLQSGDEWMVAHYLFLPFLQRETTLSLPACCLGWGSSCKVEMSGWWLTISPIFTKENNFESTCLLPWMGKLLQSGDEWMVAHCLFLPLLQWETTLSLPACCLGWGSSCKVGMSGWWLTIYFSHFYNGKQLWVYLLVVLDGEALAKWGWVDGGSLFISPIFTMGNNFESTCLLSWMGKLLQSGDEWMMAHYFSHFYKGKQLWVYLLVALDGEALAKWRWVGDGSLFLPFLQRKTTLSLPACCLGWGSSCKVGMSGWWLTVYFSHFYNGKQLWVYLLIVLDEEALAKWGWVDDGSLFISPIFTMGNNFESTCLLSWMRKVGMSGWWLTVYFSHFYKGKQLWVYLLVALDEEALAKWGWVDGGSLFISPIFTKGNNFESTCLLSWMGKLLQSGDEWMVAHCLFLPFLQWETTLSLPACCLGWGSSCKVGMSGWWLTVYFSHFYKGKQLWVYLLVVLDGEALAKWGWVDGGSLFISPIFTKETTLSLPACCLGWGSSCKVRMSGWWLTIYFSHFYKGKQLWVYLLVVLDGEALAKWGCVDGG